MSEYLVLGMGRFGRSLATELQALGHEVIAVDSNMQLVQELSEVVRHAFAADVTSEAALRDIGVSDLDAAVVAVGAPEPSIMATLVLKKLGVPYVIAKASTERHGEILRLVGANRVVYPERETAVRLAHSIGVSDVADYLSMTGETGLIKLPVPRDLVGQSYVDAQLESKYSVRLIAVIRKDRVLFGVPVGEVFQEGDTLVLAGPDKQIRALYRYLSGQSATG